jgi:uncharacterized protein (TIGR03643 family)
MRNVKTSRSALTAGDISRVVEMAWEDRTAFEAIEGQFGLNESAVVTLMRLEMKPSSFRMWRKRTAGRVTKHAALRDAKAQAYCP